MQRAESTPDVFLTELFGPNVVYLPYFSDILTVGKEIGRNFLLKLNLLRN